MQANCKIAWNPIRRLERKAAIWLAYCFCYGLIIEAVCGEDFGITNWMTLGIHNDANDPPITFHRLCPRFRFGDQSNTNYR